MGNEVALQQNSAIADEIRDMLMEFKSEHPHATKIIAWAGVIVTGIIGICVEGAAIKNGR